MTIKLTAHPCFWILSIVLLVSCGTLPQKQTVSTPTVTQIEAQPILSETLIPSPAEIPTLLPPLTQLLPNNTLILSSPISTSFTTVTNPSQSYNLDNIRMAYVVKGNLYLQDDRNSPRQLTHSGEDSDPKIMDDGAKIVFYRGKIIDGDIYSINADGNNERALITSQWLAALGAGTKAHQNIFVPGTHQLIFNTYLCNQANLSLGCKMGLFLMDSDTGAFKAILSPRLGYLIPWNSTNLGNFAVSPDGKMLAVAFSGHIDLLNLNGQVIRRNIMTYTRSTPLELLPRQYWLSDSSGLIVALPAESRFSGGENWQPPSYTVWRYSLESNNAAQIPLDPSPIWFYMDCGDIINVSPDSNWVFYNNDTIHLGDLRDGHTQSYPLGVDCSNANWSSDNEHFVYGHYFGTFLGTVGKPLLPVDGNFLGWVDASHYIYHKSATDNEILAGEINGETILTYDSGISLPVYWFTYIMQNKKVNQ